MSKHLDQLTSQSAINFLYLHGFASSPASRKAKFFQDKIKQQSWRCATPDLNVPTFEQLSIASQIEVSQTSALQLGAGPLVLVGSSMGGLLAALLEPQLANVAALILLAPGFGITKRWPQIIGADGMAAWKETGARQFFHYGANSDKALHYAFTEELQNIQTEDFRVKTPTIVFHGVNDETVPLEHSVVFASANTKLVELVQLNDGHELAQSLDQIWSDSLKFLHRQSISLCTASDTNQN